MSLREGPITLPARQPNRLLTEVDRKCEEALQHVLRPEYHGLIAEWMRTAQDHEKRGVIELKKIAEPTLTKTIGRPAPGPLGPPEASHTWYHLKAPPGKPHRMNWPVREQRERPNHSASNPELHALSLQGTMQSPGLLGWQHEELAEAGEIDKPGGCVIKMKDSVQLMNKRNTGRNKGTFKLFGGSFDATTTNATAHGLRSIGAENWKSSSRHA